MREDRQPPPAGDGDREWRQPQRDGATTAMGDVLGVLPGERGTPGAHEALAGLVRRMMADSRARLASEDAACAPTGGGEAEGGHGDISDAGPPLRCAVRSSSPLAP